MPRLRLLRRGRLIFATLSGALGSPRALAAGRSFAALGFIDLGLGPQGSGEIAGVRKRAEVFALLGLDLQRIKLFSERHGFTLVFSSQVGVGSVFTLDFPPPLLSPRDQQT